MKSIIYKIALLLAITSQFVGYILHALSVEGAWYVFNACTHFILWFTLIISIRKPNLYRNDKWSNDITLYGLLLAGNQFIDEFFLSPNKFQWNECLVLGIIFIHIILYRKKT
jgi:hypothetical protein